MPDAMIRDGISLARSVELTAQILRAGPVNPITLEDFQLAWSGVLGEFRRVAGDLHGRLSDFIQMVVVHRTDEAIRGWRSGYVRILLFIFSSGSGLTWCHPAPFLQCEPHLMLGG